MPQIIRLEAVTPDAIAPYGQIIDWSDALEASGKAFHILARSEAATGWRLAALRVKSTSVTRLENHPETLELFAPVSGSTVLLVAEPGGNPQSRVRAFVLDRPVCLGKGVWHAILTLGQEATILIAENLEVGSQYCELEQELVTGLAQR